MTNIHTAAKWFGGLAATVVLALAATSGPAEASDAVRQSGDRIATTRDTGWNTF